MLTIVRTPRYTIAPIRRYVNDKVSEMAALMDKEVSKRRRKVVLVPTVFGRRKNNSNGNGKGGLPPRAPSLREIAEAREELMKLVLFLHLRE